MTEAKKMLDKVKFKYYESCRIVQDQEKSVCKTFTGKILNNDQDLNLAHDNLLKFRSQSEHCAQLYKYELSKFNKIVEDNEKKYQAVSDKMRSNEESRIFFIKCNMDKFGKIFEEFAMSSFDFLNVRKRVIIANL